MEEKFILTLMKPCISHKCGGSSTAWNTLCTSQAGKWSRAIGKSFTGSKCPLSRTVSSSDLQFCVSVRPSEHIINWRRALLPSHRGKWTKLFLGACLHSDKEYFLEGAPPPTDCSSGWINQTWASEMQASAAPVLPGRFIMLLLVCELI